MHAQNANTFSLIRWDAARTLAINHPQLLLQCVCVCVGKSIWHMSSSQFSTPSSWVSSRIVVHIFLVAWAVVHVDEFVLVVVLRAASAGCRTRRGAVLVAGLARFALLLLHALVFGAPVLEPHFDLLRRGREKILVRNLLRIHTFKI